MGFSIIIPAWNLWETTLACLRSLAAQDEGEALLAEVLVVDNGSTDATATALAATGESLFGSRFTRLRLEENQGFAAGCNIGARAARGSRLLFLNNDTTVASPWLAPLHEALQDSGVGAAGSLLLYPDGRNQHCGICFSLFGNPPVQMDLQFCRPHLLAPLLRVCRRPLTYSVQPPVLRMRQACPVASVQLHQQPRLKMFSFFISLCPTFLVQLTAVIACRLGRCFSWQDGSRTLQSASRIIPGVV